MYKEIIGKIIFFIFDILLLWGMFVLCNDIFHIQNIIINIILSNIVAVSISYFIYRQIIKNHSTSTKK